jgi:hypothetical protein
MVKNSKLQTPKTKKREGSVNVSPAINPSPQPKKNSVHSVNSVQRRRHQPKQDSLDS